MYSPDTMTLSHHRFIVTGAIMGEREHVKIIDWGDSEAGRFGQYR